MDAGKEERRRSASDVLVDDAVGGSNEIEALRQRVRDLEQQLGTADLASPFTADNLPSRPRTFSTTSNVSLLGDVSSRARAYSSTSFLAFEGFRPRAISGQSTLSFLEDHARPRTLSNLADYKLDLGDRLGALTTALNVDRAFTERPNSPPGTLLPFLTNRPAESDPTSPRLVFPLLPIGSPHLGAPGSASSTTTNNNYSFPVISFGAPPPPSGLNAVAAAAETLESNTASPAAAGAAASTSSTTNSTKEAATATASTTKTRAAANQPPREVKRRRALKVPSQTSTRSQSENQRKAKASVKDTVTPVAAVPSDVNEDLPTHSGMVIPAKPEPISVVKRKGTVLVLKWGAPPLAVERTIRGTAYVPDGFEVETISDRMTWIGQTRVTPPNNLQYRFFLKGDPSKSGGWHKNASRAYRDAFANLGTVSKEQLDSLKSSNGRLIIGVTYGNLQERICKIFAKEIAQMQSGGSSSRGQSTPEDDFDEDASVAEKSSKHSETA